MSPLVARDALVVFVAGEEVPGVIVYGLMKPGSRREVAFPLDVWISASAQDDYVLRGEGWQILTWDVQVDVWPLGDRWSIALRRTLQAMIASGACVAWIGAEGVPFVDPPELFLPERMSGGVLAWMTDDGASGGSLDPDFPLAPVSDEQMLGLRFHCRGLADAP